MILRFPCGSRVGCREPLSGPAQHTKPYLADLEGPVAALLAALIAKQAADDKLYQAEIAAIGNREAAKLAAAQAEADAKAAAERAERERAEAIERQKQAEARAEAEKLAAEQRAKDAAEAARQTEIKRQADEKAAEEAEQRRREEDKAHKATINNAALTAFIENGLPDECAKQAVILIAKGLIPAVKIQY